MGQKDRIAPGWVEKLAGAHLALCGLQGCSSLQGGSISPMFQKLLLQFILLLRGVKVVHGHELVA